MAWKWFGDVKVGDEVYMGERDEDGNPIPTTVVGIDDQFPAQIILTGGGLLAYGDAEYDGIDIVTGNE